MYSNLLTSDHCLEYGPTNHLPYPPQNKRTTTKHKLLSLPHNTFITFASKTPKHTHTYINDKTKCFTLFHSQPILAPPFLPKPQNPTKPLHLLYTSCSIHPTMTTSATLKPLASFTTRSPSQPTQTLTPRLAYCCADSTPRCKSITVNKRKSNNKHTQRTQEFMWFGKLPTSMEMTEKFHYKKIGR